MPCLPEAHGLGEISSLESGRLVVVEANRKRPEPSSTINGEDVTLSFVSNRASGVEPVTFH